MGSVKGAEWHDGSLSILLVGKVCSSTLVLSGFAPLDREVVSCHLEQHALAFVARPGVNSQGLPNLLNSANVIKGKVLENSKGDFPTADEQPAVAPAKVQTKPMCLEAPTDADAFADVLAQQTRGKMLLPPGRRGSDSDDDEHDTVPMFAQYTAYSTSIKEGWVWKRSAWLRKWQCRYLVLRSDGLFSYRSQIASCPTVHFEGVSDCQPSTDSGSLRTFCIRGACGDCILACEDARSREAWVSSIRRALL